MVSPCSIACKWTVPATRAMVLGMASRLSPEHAAEIRQMNRVPPVRALIHSYDNSLACYALTPPGYEWPVFLMGVEARNLLTGGAMVWMLGTTAIARFPAATLRAARWGVAQVFRVSGATYLEQYIPAWYGTGIAFCRRLGFIAERCGCSADGGEVVRVHCAAPSFSMKGILWEPQPGS